MSEYLTADELKRLFPHITPDVLARSAVPGLPHPKRQPNQRGQGEDPKLVKSTEGLGFRITILSLRKRLVDEHDNLRSGAKPLVDQITTSLGFASDDNPRLKWCYGQVKSEREGTIVMIERL